MAPSYWHKFTERRVGRRRLLASTGATAAAAAFLAACGDDDAPSTGTTATGSTGPTGAVTGPTGTTGGSTGATGSTGGATGATGPATGGLITNPVDESAKAVSGGKFVSASRVLTSLDPIGSSAIGINYLMYSTLWKKKAGYLEPYSGDMVGDLAEKWEVSGDQLQITVTLTPKAHFQGPEGSPINGREVNAHDVEYTWGKYLGIGALRDEVATEINPNSPVLSMTATDDKTVVIKLSQPDATIFGLLAQQRAGNFYVLPVESEDIEIKSISLGSGPWVMDNWQAGVGQFFKKNPGYHQDWRGENLPYLDAMDLPELQESSVATAQFRAGNVQLYSNYIPQEEILGLVSDVPELDLYQEDPINTSMRIIMGNAPGSPFLDERVRQAAMMLMDKDLMIDTLGNTKGWEDAGLPVVRTLNGAMAVDQPGFWFLDPRSSEFGENTKYFEHNPEEAKALLSAAGYPDGLDTHMTITTGYNPGILNKMNVVMAVFGGGQEGPIRYTITDLDYKVEWSPKIRFIKGAIDGVALLQDVDTPDPALYLYQRYNPNGGVFQGGDETITELTAKAKAEFDDEARKSLVYDIQRYEGKAMHFPFSHGGATTYIVNWPSVRGYNVWQGDNDGSQYNFLWRDPTKAPTA
jgi:peptide/nickel transport system substrate-binding protein